ncbi:hypothetical protein N657DRAFT_161225 [Parathielavia appendiculata]|uniref:Uncharacterized protein n=1 Tax=Parathielavia appendiculata TaxID=2587402 RepID=A0AAN6TTG3_9PEZI|nr:hypothetical protein N657DRAFT_161225 [Parathielavia appendiculata]
MRHVCVLLERTEGFGTLARPCFWVGDESSTLTALGNSAQPLNSGAKEPIQFNNLLPM